MVSVTTEHQREKLRICGIDSDIYRGAVDPSFFIGIAIQAGVNCGISAEGAVNMLQSLEMIRAPMLDESLLVEGEIKSVERVGRGERVETHVWFSDQEGQLILRADRVSLRPSKSVATDARGAGYRPQPVITDVSSLEEKGTFQLTPQIVCGYSSEGNSIHYDEEAATAGGFRAPIIGGGMGVHYLMADLWSTKRPTQFKCDIYFRRPIFWDERVSVGVDRFYRSLGLLKEPNANIGGEVKVGTEMAIVYCN